MKKYILTLLSLMLIFSCSTPDKDEEVIINVTGEVIDAYPIKGITVEDKENITRIKSDADFKKEPPKR